MRAANQLARIFFLRLGDADNPADGPPNIPEEFKAFLPPKPIRTRIVAIGTFLTRPLAGNYKFKDTPVTLDAGEKDGLRMGMELWVKLQGRAEDFVRVTKAEPTRAEGILTQFGEEEIPAPEIGWPLSSQGFVYEAENR
jgi:hypothetical protein